MIAILGALLLVAGAAIAPLGMAGRLELAVLSGILAGAGALIIFETAAHPRRNPPRRRRRPPG